MAYRFKELIKDVQANVDDRWRANYGHYVPIYIRECQAGANWSDWPDDSFDKFISFDSDRYGNFNPVASLKLPQGKFTEAEIRSIKEHWGEIIPILKEIADDQKKLQLDKYVELKRTIDKYTANNHNPMCAIHRMIAGIQPELLTTIVDGNRLNELCSNLERYTDINFRFSGGYYEKSNQVYRLIKEAVPDLSCYDIPTFAWQLHEILKDNQNDYNLAMSANKEIIDLLKDSGQIILTGAPGTGKTYKTAELALILCNSPEDAFHSREAIMEEYLNLIRNKRVFFTTFHQSMDYEDFVEGYKPVWDAAAKVMKYELRPGIFSIACAAASEHPEENFVLIIDEINRGNISKILGELITLLEFDKREGAVNALPAILTYSKKEFFVPKNLFIIGTMNSTDRSTGTIDYALRRRFQFYTLMSDINVLDSIANAEVREDAKRRFELAAEYLNDELTEGDFNDLMVGHSYFLADTKEQLERKWKYSVMPLLDEYYKDGLTKTTFEEWKENRKK